MDLEWTKSTFCADKACVEATLIEADTVAIRDGKDVSQAYLTFSRTEWLSFLDSVAAESFEVS
jgi:hypothetical protein